MRIVQALPPLIDEIDAVFHVRDRAVSDSTVSLAPQLSHSNVRFSRPRISGEIRASMVFVPHRAQGGRTMKCGSDGT